MAQVTLDDVGKVYADGTRAVTSVSLTVDDGELLVLVGPSGCGKTTVLRMIAGLETISEGTVTIADRVVNDLPSRDRDVAMVFQSYALYPHLDVRSNIGFGLKLRKVPKAEIRRRVEQAAETLGLSGLLDRKPRQLSGGQRQRVAMGRAIVREPQAFLMDEPLSNLDAKLRVQMRAEVARIQRDLATTTVYVTHDQTEAMTLGDRVAVMRQGELQQVDAPQVLYDRPVNVFVAGFIGSPAMNLMTVRLERRGDGLRFRVGEIDVDIPPGVVREHPGLVSFVDRDIGVGIRPEDMADADIGDEPSHPVVLRSTADLVEAMGSDVLVHLDLPVAPLVTEDTRELALDVGLEIEHAPHSTVVARFSPRTRAKEGDPVAVALDLDRLHFFDPDTGSSIRGDRDRADPTVPSAAGNSTEPDQEGMPS